LDPECARYQRIHKAPGFSRGEVREASSASASVPSFRSIGRRSSDQMRAEDPREELMRYYALPQVDPSVRSLDLWKIHTIEFPVLSAMARDFLAMQGSSVPSEERNLE
jgi:hypothetical protein